MGAAFFAGFGFGSQRPEQPLSATEADGAQAPDMLTKGVHALVNAYRQFGHFVAQLDPLGHNRPSHPLLDMAEYGFSEADLDRRIGRGGFLGSTDGTLRDLLEQLRLTYCQTLGSGTWTSPTRTSGPGCSNRSSRR